MSTRGIAGLLSGLALFSLLHSGMALAETETVPLERLHVHDVILLPTVRSQYEARFTKPRTWKIAPNSTINVEFQHSHELLPKRSWLQVIVNDKVIKHIPLTQENAAGSRLSIPMPVALLKDFNVLTFRVEQHYTDQCEDPLDQSLWTQVLPASHLTFNYTPVVPQVDLAFYPYPLVDPLSYSPPRVHYVIGKQASATELKALAYLNTHLAQQAQDQELQSRVTFTDPAGTDDEHLVLVGTPASVPAISQFAAHSGDYALQGNQWVNRQTQQALAPDQGVLLFFQAPGSQSHSVLIVSGNSEQAVMRAAEYLTQRPREQALMGAATAVPDGWHPPDTRSGKVPRYLENQTRTFRQLGFEIEEVHKINAPPITYHVPVVGDFRRAGSQLWLDLVYSYSPQLNPEYSSLELRMNDVSIANIPLTNPNGEQMKRASIPVSNELVQTQNDLVAQFHLMPEKYGWCVDNYEDHAWGKIMDDSQFRVEGGVGSRLPDAGLLNGTMYPYSTTDNLQTLQVVLPADPTPELLNAMLAFTTRLGRSTLADTGLRFELSQGAERISDRHHLAVFRYSADPLSLPAGSRLLWQADGHGLLKTLSLPDTQSTIALKTTELGHGPNVEQYLDGNRAISVFTGHDAGDFAALDQLFETDRVFKDLSSGLLQQLSNLNPQLNAINPPDFHLEDTDRGSWWANAWHWLQNLPWTLIIGGLLGLFLLVLGLPLLVRRILNR